MGKQEQKSIQPQPSEEYKELQKQFDALCNEMDMLYRADFEKVFDKLFKIDTTLNKNFPCTENKDSIREAVLQAGFGGDEAFINDFIKYNRLFVEGKQIQKKGLEIMAQDFTGLISQQEKQQSKPDEWQFVGFNIIASPELHDGINEILKDEAEHGKGLFANVTDIHLEDIDEDEFDMVEVYNCQATLTKYFAELKRFGIIGAVEDEAFLNKTFKNTLMGLLRGLATYIKENTDKQAATKNEITNTIKILDELPHWGLFLQILILQGLCRWLESVNINEWDKGFDEAQALYDWLWEHLAEKIMNLAFKPYSDGDKARLKPLTDYLYSTEVGRWVQEQIFSKPQQKDITDYQISLQEELNTERAIKYFPRALEVGYMEQTDTGYKWLYGGSKGQVRLGYFCNKVYSTPRPINKLEELFGVKKLSSSISSADCEAKREDVKKWRKEMNDTIFFD